MAYRKNQAAVHSELPSPLYSHKENYNEASIVSCPSTKFLFLPHSMSNPQSSSLDEVDEIDRLTSDIGYEEKEYLYDLRHPRNNLSTPAPRSLRRERIMKMRQRLEVLKANEKLEGAETPRGRMYRAIGETLPHRILGLLMEPMDGETRTWMDALLDRLGDEYRQPEESPPTDSDGKSPPSVDEGSPKEEDPVMTEQQYKDAVEEGLFDDAPQTVEHREKASEYNISTLIDIARIPSERIPDLLAQMPRILDQIRPLVDLVDAMGEEQAKIFAKKMVWIDDGICDGSGDKMTVALIPPKP